VNPAPLPDDVRTAIDGAGARLALFSGRLLWYASVPSTNELASRLAVGGAPEGMVVAANMQTMGRGRLGRQWSSPPDAGIYMSVLLRPPGDVVSMLTIAAGVAVAEGIQAATGLRTLLKWPNDVYAGGRKLAGLLAEAGTTGAGLSHAIVGIGINLMPAAYPPDVASRATSIESELGRAVDRGMVLAECLAALAQRYGDVREGRRGEIVARWRERAAATFGRQVEWDAADRVKRGVVLDIDESGALMVRCGDDRVRIISGEVRWTS
jgi:BirA family biotin operon repressor/biotin-[acetyl-CoA-carboxylase] ligase